MTTLFLKAKHWQLFVLFCIMPIISYILLIVKVMVSVAVNEAKDIDGIVSEYTSIFQFVTAFTLIVVSAWYLSIALELRSKIPAHLRMNLYLFLFAFIPLLIYIATMKSYPDFTVENIKNFDFTYLIIDGISQLVCIACLFYIFFFVSKTFKTAELQRELKFADYSSELFMLCLFPIGVWLIQPRINALVDPILSDSNTVNQ